MRALRAGLVNSLLSFVVVLMALQGPIAVADEPTEPTGPATVAVGSGSYDLKINCRNPEAQDILRSALNDSEYWGDAVITTYNKELYDEIRLKPLATGYVPMITGEGAADFDHDVVAEIVFHHQDRLPLHMEGAKAVVNLGSGYDAEMGAEYQDAFMFLDLTVLYVKFPQRMYRKTDGDKTVLWFEKLDSSFVDAATWAEYQETMTKTEEGLSLRWAFGGVEEVTEIYGMFIVHEGTVHKTRITFISKLVFGPDAGWIARWGSQLKSVLRSGLRNGFDASVAIAAWRQEKRDKGEL